MSADDPAPLDLDAIRAMLGDRLAVTTRSVALDLLAEVERLRAELDQAAPHITYDKGYLDGARAARPTPAPDKDAIRRAEAHVKLDALDADLDLLVDVAASGIPADVLRPILRTYSHAAIDVIPRPLGSIPGGVA